MIEERTAVITGDKISGFVDTPDPRIPQDTVDVTNSVLYFDELMHGKLVIDAIEQMHYANGTHPLQQECAHLNNAEAHPNGVNEDWIAQHQAAHDKLKIHIVAPIDDRLAAIVQATIVKEES